MELSSESLSPPHEEPTMDDSLSDVIDRIGRLNLDSIPTQSNEQPGPSQKSSPKWLTKSLENIGPDEVGKTRTRSSTWKNGGDVDDSDSLVDMDVLIIVNSICLHILNQLPSNKSLLMMKGKKR